MADSPNIQRNLRSRGPNGRVLPSNSETNPSTNGEQTDDNTAALNNLLSPLGQGPQPPTAHNGASSSRQPANGAQDRSTLRPISSWRPNARNLGQLSIPDAVSTDLDDEGVRRDARLSLRTASEDSEDDPLAPAFFLEGTPHEFDNPDSVPSARATISAQHAHGKPTTRYHWCH